MRTGFEYAPGMKKGRWPSTFTPGGNSMSLELLTADEIAERLRLRPRTVRQWARRGLIPVIRLSPKVVRFELADVVAAVRSRAPRGGGQ
jgi:excisionase family DNA binding protein